MSNSDGYRNQTLGNEKLGVSGRLAKFFLASPLTPLLALIAALLGLWAVAITPKEEEPQIDVTMANIVIPFAGANAQDVETLVAIPAEQVFSQMPGVEHVYSVSRSGAAILTVQFKVGVTRNDALVRLYDTLHSHRDGLPKALGVGEPVIKPKGIDDVPVVSFTLWTPDQERAAYDLERIAHAMEQELKRVPGTRTVETLGGPGRELRIEIDPDRLRAVELSALEVTQALQAANAAMPAGKLVVDNTVLHIESGEFLRNAREVESLVVGVFEGRPVYLSSVAKVIDGPAQPSRYVWLGMGPAATVKGIYVNGDATHKEFPAVTLAITKKAGENAVNVAEALVTRVDELRGVLVPQGVEVTITRNYGETANDKAMKLIQKLVFATLSVIILVLMALGYREALIVGGAVLLTLAVTLFASWAWGFTLNRVSLFALIFSIGILVDDAIVVVENIHRHRQLQPGASLRELIPGAVDEVGGPTILATFTVIAALLPMAFVSGLMGPYMSPIPINASMGMLISLAVAFVVTPWMAVRIMSRQTDQHHEGRLDRALPPLFARLITPFLDATAGKRRRHWLYGSMLSLIVLAASLGVIKWVVLKMLPFDNKSEFQVVVDMPAGTPLETTAAAVHALARIVASVPEVTDYQAYVGTASPINFNGLVRQYYFRSDSEQADIQVNLVDKHLRAQQSHQIAGALRPALEAEAARWSAKVKVVEVPPGPPVMSPLVAEIYGPDEAGRLQFAAQVRDIFENTADIVGVDDSMAEVAPQQRIVIDRNKAIQLGVPTAPVVQTLALALTGIPVTPLFAEGAKYEVPVVVTLSPDQKSRLTETLKLGVKAADGRLVPLSALVQVREEVREQTRYRKDLLSVTYVTGDMAGATDSPLYGMFAMRSAIENLSLPNGAHYNEHFISAPQDPWRGYHLKWEGEWQITYETFRDMGAAYGVGLIFIYLLVVAQFKSYSVPIIIMAPIPLTMMGVMPGHALLGAHFTATSMIGMIALAGIIVRNSILLVDFIDVQIAQGIPLEKAVVQAASTRAKPIALTGLAAMLGAFFILDDPIFNGLAISLIFGILVSTLLTLVVVPVAYYALKCRQCPQASPDVATRLGGLIHTIPRS